jgi:serine/threonine protein kinase
MTDELIGRIIDGYEIQGIIGHGGMATVYRAQQVSMKRVVAMKVLPSQFVNDDTYIQRFNREVEIVSKLEHRNIVPVYDYGQYQGQPYIIMRYMSGGSVDDMLANGPLDIETALSIVQQIAPALDYAHSKDILHRDLKPSNILLDDDRGAYLTDFGIARIIGQKPGATITTQGVVGTPSYMSPEQAQGHPLDARSDIYALGVALFEMATGRRPFHSDTPYSIAVMQVTTPPPAPRSFNPALSIAVEQVILRALRKKPDERYASATLLAEALKRALEPAGSSVHDTQPGIPRPRPVPAPAAAPPPAPMPQPQPQAVPPPPRYPTTPPQQPARAPSSANMRPARRARARRQDGGSLWMSAAVGGLIGCGLLTIIVIIAAILISSVQAVSGAAPGLPPAALPTQAETMNTALPPPTLDPASEAARSRLLGTPVPETIPSATPTIVPVGVRDP